MSAVVERAKTGNEDKSRGSKRTVGEVGEINDDDLVRHVEEVEAALLGEDGKQSDIYDDILLEHVQAVELQLLGGRVLTTGKKSFDGEEKGNNSCMDDDSCSFDGSSDYSEYSVEEDDEFIGDKIEDSGKQSDSKTGKRGDDSGDDDFIEPPPSNKKRGKAVVVWSEGAVGKGNEKRALEDAAKIGITIDEVYGYADL